MDLDITGPLIKKDIIPIMMLNEKLRIYIVTINYTPIYDNIVINPMVAFP
ncbi:MAG: hypothetical protein AB7V56_04560 [Candidatus Nitrosocosmicus sp.]